MLESSFYTLSICAVSGYLFPFYPTPPFHRILMDSQLWTLALEDQRSHTHCLPFNHRELKFLLLLEMLYICFLYFSINFSLINHISISSSQYVRESICSVIDLRMSSCPSVNWCHCTPVPPLALHQDSPWASALFTEPRVFLVWGLLLDFVKHSFYECVYITGKHLYATVTFE